MARMTINENVNRNVKVKEEVRNVIIRDFATGVGSVKASDITAKGDVIAGTGSGSYGIVPVGADGYVFTARSTAAKGVAWEAPQGGQADISVFQARLTLVTATPITTTDQTAKTEIFLTPFEGNILGLRYDSGWSRYTLSEISIKVTDDAQTGDTVNGAPEITNLADTSQLVAGMEVSGTGIPGGALIQSVDSSTQITMDANATADGTGVSITFKVPADTNFDIFVKRLASSNKLYMVLWTDDTTRATEVTTSDGIYVLTGDADMRFVGTCRTTSTAGQVEDSYQYRYVNNCYNQVKRPLRFVDATSSWTYNQTTYRQMRNTAANKVNFVIGVEKEPVFVKQLILAGSSAAGRYPQISIGLDAVNASANGANESYCGNPTSADYDTLNAEWGDFTGVGYHYLAPIEKCRTAASSTFYGGSTNGKHLFHGWVYG
jgi:hypothetical protein